MNIAFLRELRELEMTDLLPWFPRGAKVLELGAGAGWQSALLARHGCEVKALDVAGSLYEGVQAFPVGVFDGVHLPFEDDSFDVVYSSSVIEHMQDPSALFSEIRRVLTPGGYGLHAVPGGGWRFWTTVALLAFQVRRVAQALLKPGTSIPSWPERWIAARRCLVWPKRHGERGTAFLELLTFSRWGWTRFFARQGWMVTWADGNHLFYTGMGLLSERWPLPQRRRMSWLLGSVCHVFKVIPAEDKPHGKGLP